jgi:hypothetical protein
MDIHRAAIVTLLLAVVPATGTAQTVTVSKHSNPAPDELAAPIKELLSPSGATAKMVDNTLDFWWVNSLPSKDAGEGWSGVPEGTLMGAMRVAMPLRDIRGRAVKPGVYVLRYALQPQNGDHLGVSPYREFLLVAPAAEDTSPGPLGHDPAVELAAKTTGIAHPAVLSIDPPVAQEAALAVRQNEAGHTAVVFEVPTSTGKTLKFGLVLVGHIEA